jgi:guanylate kinase
VLAGPSGVGKGTVATQLAARVPRLWPSRSWTTRPRRVGEPADAYVFVTREQFERAIEEGEFLEWAEFVGNLYGTPHPVAPVDRCVLLEIDVQGAQRVREVFADKAFIAFIDAPDAVELERRLRGRGGLSDSAVEQRLQRARLERAHAERIADVIVVNDQVERVVGELAAMIVSRITPSD